MNNLDLYTYSKNNYDDLNKIVDPKGVVVITDDLDNPNELMKQVDQLNSLINFYSNLKDMDHKTEELKNETIDKISNILEKNKNININFAPFCVYFQVMKYPYSSYLDTPDEKKREVLIKLLDSYLINRFNLYKANGYTHTTLQVMSDSAESRRNGNTANVIINNYLAPLGFIHARNIFEFESNSNCFIFPDRGDLSLFDMITSDLKLKLEFRRTHQNKNPDALIKVKDKIIILEHKLITSSGGAQYEAMNELITFINQNEDAKNVCYVGMLQGNYWNGLNYSDSPKLTTQRNNIQINLGSHPSNYFVNGNGLIKLIEEMKI